MVEECLEEVGDNELVGIAKVDTIDAEIDSGHVDEVGGIVVITVHCGQTSAGGGGHFVTVRWS